MKKVLNIFNVIISSIVLLLSLIFILIEGRLLFSGDWLIYDNVILGMFKYLFRLIIAISAGMYSILTFINIKKKSGILTNFLFMLSICLFIVSIFMLIYTANYVDKISIIIASIILLINVSNIVLLYIRKKQDQLHFNSY